MRRRVIVPGSIVVAAMLAVGLPSAPAHAASSKYKGTITWTRTVAIDGTDSGGDRTTGTETTSATIRLTMTKRPRAASFQLEDNGSSYSGSFTTNTQRTELDSGGGASCVVTHNANGNGAGKMPKRPTSTSAPALFANIVPARSAVGSGTKAIILTPILRYSGEDTITYVGQGISPCSNGQDVDPIDGTLNPGGDARQVCYPAGTSKAIATPTANDVVGAWNQRKKAFVFDCTRTYADGAGATVTVKVSGALKPA